MKCAPVLFLVFNRPETTQYVFEKIKQAKPEKLFIASDGPREHIALDYEQCERVKQIVADINWPCEVHTLFRTENLGCGRAVSSAITWFFSHVEEGIILEDDCVPDMSFFGFSSQMLSLYRDSERVMMISGTSYLFNKFEKRASYFFSNYYAIWGWATWRRAWALYDFNLDKFNERLTIERLGPFLKSKECVDRYIKWFKEVKMGYADSWGYQWCYACLMHHGLCVTPIVNLVSNIGFLGAHASCRSRFNNMPIRSIDLGKFHHPKEIELDQVLSRRIYRIVRRSQPLKTFLILAAKKQIKTFFYQIKRAVSSLVDNS